MSRDHPSRDELPVPIIDSTRYSGCGLCVRTCPTHALDVRRGKATVADPATCDYADICQHICPAGAIQGRFEVVPT
ncbi:MAG: ATP-binding protein [Anaerolineae bacterium]